MVTVFLGPPLLAQRRSGSFRHPLLPPLPVNSTGLGQNNRKECQVHVLDRPIIHFHTLSHTHNGGEGEGTPLPGPGPLLPGPGKIFLAKLAKKSVIFGQIVECYGLNNYILQCYSIYWAKYVAEKAIFFYQTQIRVCVSTLTNFRSRSKILYID